MLGRIVYKKLEKDCYVRYPHSVFLIRPGTLFFGILVTFAVGGIAGAVLSVLVRAGLKLF